MFTLKKSLLLLFFLGTISLSLCEQERGADEEENGEREMKRNIFEIFRNRNRGGLIKDAATPWLPCEILRPC
uniref:Ishikawain-4 protein n=1 Tax=Odorrana ishikawae TaxID=310659 RepID=G3XHP7_ODOIS|nr:Ishikawain-4 precursor protein [Odorrana ishikawae]